MTAQKMMAPLSKRWFSLKLTEKFGVVFILLLLIGMVGMSISLTALRIVEKVANAAQSSLDTQRISLEMSRDWEVVQNYQYRFFTQYQEIGFNEAKELYAIPAGETLSNIIRVGAVLRRMTSAPGASENFQEHDAVMQQYLSDISAYAVGLESAVQLASATDVQNEQQIQEKLVELDTLTRSIEPSFTELILMAQYEVVHAQDQIKQTQQVVSIFLVIANLFGIALIGLIIYAFNKNISANVARLTNASARMQKGYMEERIDILSSDEFGQIGAAFNDMAGSIQERTQSLSESEARYRELVTAAPYFVFVLQEERFVYANPACLKSLSYDVDSFIGMEMLTVVHSEDHTLIEEWLKNQELGNTHQPAEIRIFDRGRQIVNLEIVAVPIIYNHKPAVLGIGQDITQRRQMEKAMIETEKLAGIGTLAAGIAHEINTPLQVITGYSGSIGREIEAGDLVQTANLGRKIASIDRNAWRIANIVKSLLDYARPSTNRAEYHALSDIIEKTLLLIEHQLTSWSNIKIEKDLAPDLPPLMCDSNRIAQVLINLLNNAADAMPDGGQITIRTGFNEENQQFSLQVSDTGIGIPDNLQSRVFDPFFTTKDIGKGTGLGLSISRGIVEVHGGAIDLQSETGKGTTFTISLPQELPDKPPGNLARLEKGRYDN